MEDIKIILIGPSGVGKTTLKKIFFDQENPFDLISYTFEPTIDKQIDLYDFGVKMAVHDLAGQQLDEWMQGSENDFRGTNLILCVLDCRETWESNIQIIEKIQDIQSKKCPNSHFVTFLHKVDLISTKEMYVISEKLKNHFRSDDEKSHNIHFTSIRQEFLVETFKYTLSSIKSCLSKVETSRTSEIFIKMEIMNQFVGRNLINLDDIFANVENHVIKIKSILQELQKQGFLYLVESLDMIKLSKKGETAISNLKERLYLKIQEELEPKQIILKALIISDKFGRTLITFENISNYIASLKVNEDVSTNPELISMFYSAINDFGLTIDKNGFSTIEFTGEDQNLLFIKEQDIFGIFFTERVEDKKFLKTQLSRFILEFYESFKDFIKSFIATGSLKDVKQIRKSILLRIRELNKKLLPNYQF